MPEKYLLEKTATLKRFEYSPLGKELKAQTAITKKQYQKLDNTYEFDKIFKKEKPTLENYNKSNIIVIVKNLKTFLNDLDKFNKLKTLKEKAEKKKTNVYDKASELYNDLLQKYFDEYYDLSDA